MKKKIASSLCLLLVLILALCSCALGGGSSTPSVADSTTATVTLNWGLYEETEAFAENEPTLELEFDKGEKINSKLKKESGKVSFKGYIFKGWYLDEDYEEAVKSTTKITEDMDVFAYFAKYDCETDGGHIWEQTATGKDKYTTVTANCAHPGQRYRTCSMCDAKDYDTAYEEQNPQTEDHVYGSDGYCEICDFQGPNGMCRTTHDLYTVSEVAVSCLKDGSITYGCHKCIWTRTDTLQKTGHSFSTELSTEPAKCYKDGYTYYACLNKGCTQQKKVGTVSATGYHNLPTEWTVTSYPTSFCAGQKEKACKNYGCTYKETQSVTPLGDIYSLNIPLVKYTGGKYNNADFINISSYAGAQASSYYRTTTAKNGVDQSVTTYWQADTMVEGAQFTGDTYEILFEEDFEIGVLRVTVPNYYGWGLGDTCFVSYDVYAWENDEYVKIGEISDAITKSTAQKAVCELVLSAPVTTSKIELKVTHSTRYTPAIVYEAEVYAHVNASDLVAVDLAGSANASVSGKYNNYAGGADMLVDKDYKTEWYTDARGKLNGSMKYTYYEYALGDEPVELSQIVVTLDKYVGEKINVQTYDGTSWTYWTSGEDNFYTVTASDDSTVVLTLNKTISATKIRLNGDCYKPADDLTSSVADVHPHVTELSFTTGEGTTTVPASNITWTEKGRVYCTLEFSSLQYCAYVKFRGNAKKYSVQIKVVDGDHPDGYFVELGQFANNLNENNITNFLDGEDSASSTARRVSVYNEYYTVDIDAYILAVRIEVIDCLNIYGDMVYEVEPYSIAKIGMGLTSYSGCEHKLANTSKKTVVKPTCTEAGYTTAPCRGTNCTYIHKTDAVDATGHSFGEYEVMNNPSATENGLLVATCKYCTAEKEQVLPAIIGGEILESATITKYYNDAPAAWSFSFDDGNYDYTYDWVTPQLVEYGFKATCVMTVQFSNSMVDKWKTYLSTGAWDIGSHSYAHTGIYGGTVAETSGIADVNDAVFVLMNWFPGQKILGFATPNGATSGSASAFITDFHAAVRNGGVTTWNDPDQLTSREAWGNLGSYISKFNQSEGTFEYVKRSEVTTNYVYDETTNRLTNQSSLEGGSYYYEECLMGKETVPYRYSWKATGSYDKNGETYTWRNDNDGEYVLVHTELGSYEQGINQLLAGGYWTVECMHSLGWGDIYSTYVSTMSKFEYLKATGVWVGSYNEVIQYIKERQNCTVNVVTATETEMTLSLTDTLADFMFDFPLTVKVDVPDTGWDDLTVTQDGDAIDFFIKGGYVYLNAVPDAGEIVITKN